MQADIITIGDEILIGQIIDSNSAFIAKELNGIGVSVYQITSIQDDRHHIQQALAAASARSQVVIITGGLGPTKDDVTKSVLCDFFDDVLIQDVTVLQHIEALFAKYISTPISDLNRQQAMVPSKAQLLHNQFGTAPGLWMEKENTVFVALPGVPFEMMELLTKEVLPKIVTTFERPHIVHRTIMTYGWGESAIANTIADWENGLPADIKLAYLPSLGRVRLRLSAKGPNRVELEERVAVEIKKLYPLIGEIIYGETDDAPIEATIGRLLTEKGMTLATAESFTGGKIAEQLTAIPGASKYFKGSIVSYATATKVQLLGVEQAVIDRDSVVSEAVAKAMAQNVKELMKTDFALATTGNAGPSKGDSEEAVGTVFLGVSTPTHTFAKKFTLGKHRTRIVQKGVNRAFELLYNEVINF
ncbi:MAG: competence/damage-inducible protein A [Bacteroidota bacterium]